MKRGGISYLSLHNYICHREKREHKLENKAGRKRKAPSNGKSGFSELPLVEAGPLDVALEPLVLDDELHPLEEGGRDGRGLLPEQDVDWLRHRVAELAVLADRVLTALGVLAIGQTV